MTNYEIIRAEALAHGIYDEDELEEIEVTTGDIPLHTFAFWKKYGYFVKKGEKAMITTALWRYKKGKKADEKTDEELAVDPEDDPSHYYKTKAFLFHVSQVERVGV